MATTYKGSLLFQVFGVLKKDLDIGHATLDVNYSNKHAITNGSGVDQADMIWTDTRTLAPSANEDIDLYGVLVNAFGDTIELKPKGMFAIYDPSGSSVSNSSSDIINIENNSEADSQIYDIILIGALD